ncbi:MAG: ATPase [Blastocatellia bacterium]
MNGHIVCIASEHKGNEFLEAAAETGWFVTLVTRKKLLNEPWCWTAVNDVRTVEDAASPTDYVRAVTNIAGSRAIDRVVGLDEFDIVTAARVREHLQIDGMSSSDALKFRDKLAMRRVASSSGIACPDFTGVFNAEAINRFLADTGFPLIVKPRFEVSAFGIRKCETPEQVWSVLNDLDRRNNWRDHPSRFLIERFIEGSVFHVDSVVEGGRVRAFGISQYGVPPFSITHYGGVFTSSIVRYGSAERKRLEALNRKLISAFGLKRGVTHAEFLLGRNDGKFYLLEVACRVGGAYIANMIEYACNFNLWREWARLETTPTDARYRPPKTKQEYAGIALALSKTDEPDTSHYTDPEIVYRVRKPRHVGLIFHSKDIGRIADLLQLYTRRITEDFLATAPAKERYDD